MLTAQSADIQHVSRLKGFRTPTVVFGTMGKQMSGPFTPRRGQGGKGRDSIQLLFKLMLQVTYADGKIGENGSLHVRFRGGAKPFQIALTQT